MRLPLEQFKGLVIKAGDTVNLKVVSVSDKDVQFEYVNDKDTAPKPMNTNTDENIKQPEKPLTKDDNPETMPLAELRSKLPQKSEE